LILSSTQFEKFIFELKVYVILIIYAIETHKD